MGYFWTEAEVNQRLDNIMTESFNDVIAYAKTTASTTASLPTCSPSTA